MSIFEFSCDEDTGSGDHVSFGADSFGSAYGTSITPRCKVNATATP